MYARICFSSAALTPVIEMCNFGGKFGLENVGAAETSKSIARVTTIPANLLPICSRQVRGRQVYFLRLAFKVV